jgi:hypothetical protein
VSRCLTCGVLFDLFRLVPAGLCRERLALAGSLAGSLAGWLCTCHRTAAAPLPWNSPDADAVLAFLPIFSSRYIAPDVLFAEIQVRTHRLFYTRYLSTCLPTIYLPILDRCLQLSSSSTTHTYTHTRTLSPQSFRFRDTGPARVSSTALYGTSQTTVISCVLSGWGDRCAALALRSTALFFPCLPRPDAPTTGHLCSTITPLLTNYITCCRIDPSTIVPPLLLLLLLLSLGTAVCVDISFVPILSLFPSSYTPCDVFFPLTLKPRLESLRFRPVLGFSAGGRREGQPAKSNAHASGLNRCICLSPTRVFLRLRKAKPLPQPADPTRDTHPLQSTTPHTVFQTPTSRRRESRTGSKFLVCEPFSFLTAREQPGDNLPSPVGADQSTFDFQRRRLAIGHLSRPKYRDQDEPQLAKFSLPTTATTTRRPIIILSAVPRDIC